jgi:GNAT superfamily N-acetyltransferase
MHKIRVARETDIPAMLALARAMVAESNYANLPFDEQVTTETLRKMVRSRTCGVWLAVDNEDTIGLIAGQVSRATFSQEVVAQDHVLYVQPDYRGSGPTAVDSLLRSFCLWAAEQGARRITLCNSAGAHDAAYVKKLGRYGFKWAGSVMYMEVG